MTMQPNRWSERDAGGGVRASGPAARTTDDLEAKIFYPSRKKLLGLVFLSVVFTGCGLVAINGQPFWGWLGTGFFGLSTVVLLLGCLPGSSYLRISPDGLEMCALYRKHLVRWADIRGFRPVQISRQTMVGIEFAGSYPRSRLGRQISRVVAGVEGALPDTYGHSAADLAEFLNQYKQLTEG